MPITPQTKRPGLSATHVLVGAPVGADTWQRTAALLNWLGARGAVLVPWCTPGVEATSSTSQTFRFYVQPRRSAIERRWLVELDATEAAAIKIRAPGSGGVDVELTIPAGRSLQTYAEALSVSSGASQEISFAIEVSTTDADITVRRIYCAEIDRASLEQDAVDYAVDLVGTCAPGQPMYQGAAASGRSIGGVIEALAYVDTRRAGLFHWTVGDTAVTRTSAVKAALTALAVPLLAAKELRGDTTGVVMWTAYCRMASAGTGSVQVATSASGVNDAPSVTATSFGWLTPRAISIDCEDLSTADGRQGGSFDDLTMSIGGSGSVAIEIKSLSVYVDRAQSFIGGAT